jgi:hypothetical protein
MFRVYFTNLSFWAEDFETEAEALTYGKKAHFEFSIWRGNTLVFAWSPIGGGRQYLSDPDVECD